MLFNLTYLGNSLLVSVRAGAKFRGNAVANTVWFSEAICDIIWNSIVCVCVYTHTRKMRPAKVLTFGLCVCSLHKHTTGRFVRESVFVCVTEGCTHVHTHTYIFTKANGPNNRWLPGVCYTRSIRTHSNTCIESFSWVVAVNGWMTLSRRVTIPANTSHNSKPRERYKRLDIPLNQSSSTHSG
mgnify:CR=1 FL=1